jgi:hypothetical protein
MSLYYYCYLVLSHHNLYCRYPVPSQDRCHRIGQKKRVVTYRLLTSGSVEIDMMRKQMSKKKLERLTMQGGDYRKAGRREGQQQVTLQELKELLQDDVKNLHRRDREVAGGLTAAEAAHGSAAAEWIQRDISDAELDLIMSRDKMFPELAPSFNARLPAAASVVSLQSVEGATSVESAGSASVSHSGRKRKAGGAAAAAQEAEAKVELDYGEYLQAAAAATLGADAALVPVARCSTPVQSPTKRGGRKTPGASPHALPPSSAAAETSSSSSSAADAVDVALAAAWERERVAAQTASVQGSVPLEGEMYDIVPECRANQQILLSLS